MVLLKNVLNYEFFLSYLKWEKPCYTDENLKYCFHLSEVGIYHGKAALFDLAEEAAA